MSKRKLLTWILVLAMLMPILAACGKKATPTATPAPAATQPAEATQPAAKPQPTKAPEKKAPEIGTKDHPIRVVFVPSGNTQTILSGAKHLDDLLYKQTGLYFKSTVATSYAAAIEAMCAGKADVGWLATFAYVLAHDKCGVNVKLITVRYGKSYYRGQIIVRADSGIDKIEDLKGKKFAFVDPASTSGYLYPSAMFKEHGIDPEKDFSQTVFAGSHNAVVLAVYKGQVDGGATYEDARSTISKDFPDVKQKVKVIAYTDKIPNDTVSVRKDLPEDIQKKITDGLLALSKTDEGKKALKEIYNIAGLVPGEDSAFDPVRKTAKIMGIDLEEAIKPEEKKAKPTPKPAAKAESKFANVDPSNQTVLFWHVSTKKHLEVLNKIVDGFNSTNQWHITIKPEYAGYYGDIYKKIIAAISAGEPPDLAIGYANQVAEYANAGAIAPLDPFMNDPKYGFTEDQKKDFMWNLLEGDKRPEFDNQYMSFAHSRSMQVMYYNIDWLKEMGYEKPPETWDQFKEMCVKATKGDKHGYAYSGSASLYAMMVWSYGGSLVSEDGKKIAFNSEAGLKALQTLKDLFDSGCAYQIAERYGDQTDFANQKALFTFGSTAGLPYYRSAVEKSKAGAFNWDIAMPPHGEGQKPVVDVYGPSVAIFKTKPEKELAAWLFLKYWSEPENVATWATHANYFPITKSAMETDTFKEYLKTHPRYKKALDFLPYGRMEPSFAGYQEVRGIITDMMKEVIEGAEPKAALEKAAKKAQAAMSQ